MRCAWLVFGLLAAGCYDEEPLEVANGIELARQQRFPTEDVEYTQQE